MNAANQKSEKIANKIIFWGIYISMLNPLIISEYWLLPDKFAKAVIFRITVEIILIAYIFLVLRDKKYLPRFDILSFAAAGFWTAALLSVIFSTQPFTSVWGSATRGSGFFNFTHYVILFFILKGVAREKSQWQKIFYFSAAQNGNRDNNNQKNGNDNFFVFFDKFVHKLIYELRTIKFHAFLGNIRRK